MNDATKPSALTNEAAAEPAEKWYGFYSESANQTRVPSVYKTPDGRTVEVHAVYTDPNGAKFKLADKVCVGEVVSPKAGGCVRGGQKRSVLLAD